MVKIKTNLGDFQCLRAQFPKVDKRKMLVLEFESIHKIPINFIVKLKGEKDYNGGVIDFNSIPSSKVEGVNLECKLHKVTYFKGNVKLDFIEIPDLFEKSVHRTINVRCYFKIQG